MTVAAVAPDITFLGNGSAAPLAVPFRFLAPDDLVVTRIAPGNVLSVLTRGVDYSVAGAGLPSGTVTPIAPIAVGTKWRITRATPRTQPTDYVTGDAFPAETHELALDRAMLVAQEQDALLADVGSRALRVPSGETVVQLPGIIERALRWLRFDAAGSPWLVSAASMAADLLPFIPSGPQGLPGINGGQGSSSGYGGLFAAANGMTVGTGITRVKLSGYSVAGIGGADYVQDAAVTAGTVAANPRTQFLAADGRGFKLDPTQRLAIEMFGGLSGGTMAANGANNHAAMMAAALLKPYPAINYSPEINFGVGIYYVSATFAPTTICNFRGLTKGRSNGGIPGVVSTRLIWPTNTCCIKQVYDPAAIGQGQGCYFEGFSIEQETLAATFNAAACGVLSRYTIFLRNCEFNTIAGHGIEIGGIGGDPDPALNGNCNDWRLENCYVDNCRGNGLYVWGADGNAGVCTGFVTGGTIGLCGIKDTAFFVNTYIGSQITGYNNTGVQYAGRRWQPVATYEPNLGLNAPGGNPNFWLDRGPLAAPTADFPLWVSGASYRTLGPIVATSPATFIGTYLEGGGDYGYMHAPVGTVIGPDMGWSEMTPTIQPSADYGLIAKRGIGHSRGTRGQGAAHKAYAAIGERELTLIGNPVGQSEADSYDRAWILTHEVDGATLNLGYRNFAGFPTKDICHTYRSIPQWTISGKGTAQTFGRDAPVEGIFSLFDHAITSPENGGDTRIHGMRSAAPTGGYHAQGEFMWNPAPSAGGVLGWSCVAAGTPGTWKPVMIAA